MRAPALRKQSDFAFLRALRGLEIALFHEISSSDTYMGAPMRNLGLVQTFSLLHVWSCGFAYSEIQPQWQAEKYAQRKRIGESMENLNFPVRNFDIVCGSLATQHARWHKSITLQEAGPSLRVTLGSPCEPQLCVSKAILHF